MKQLGWQTFISSFTLVYITVKMMAVILMFHIVPGPVVHLAVRSTPDMRQFDVTWDPPAHSGSNLKYQLLVTSANRVCRSHGGLLCGTRLKTTLRNQFSPT